LHYVALWGSSIPLFFDETSSLSWETPSQSSLVTFLAAASVYLILTFTRKGACVGGKGAFPFGMILPSRDDAIFTAPQVRPPPFLTPGVLLTGK